MSYFDFPFMPHTLRIINSHLPDFFEADHQSGKYSIEERVWSMEKKIPSDNVLVEAVVGAASILIALGCSGQCPPVSKRNANSFLFL